MPLDAEGGQCSRFEQRLDEEHVAGASAAAQELLPAQGLPQAPQLDRGGSADPRGQQRHGRLGAQHGRVQGHGIGVQQGPDGDLVPDRGFGHRDPDRDALAGEVALQLAELAAVAHDHGDVAEFAAVVELGFQDPLRHVAQFVHR